MVAKSLLIEEYELRIQNQFCCFGFFVCKLFVTRSSFEEQ